MSHLPERSFAELLTQLPDGGAVVTADGALAARDVPGSLPEPPARWPSSA